MLTDSHAHLTSSFLFDSLPSVLERAKEANVSLIINICTDLLSLERGLELSKQYHWIHQVAATTPHDVEKEGESAFHAIAESARKGDLIGIGETGLDYHYEHSSRFIQQTFLRRYLQLALECNLPVVIHCRDAFKDLFEILDAEYRSNGRYGPGVLHCFTGNRQEAEEVIKRGWMLSLSGIVTFKKSLELQEIARDIPINQLLIETDSPYLAPQSKRGTVNEPANLFEIAQYLAHLRQISLSDLAQAITRNAKTLFCL